MRNYVKKRNHEVHFYIFYFSTYICPFEDCQCPLYKCTCLKLCILHSLWVLYKKLLKKGIPMKIFYFYYILTFLHSFSMILAFSYIWDQFFIEYHMFLNEMGKHSKKCIHKCHNFWWDIIFWHFYLLDPFLCFLTLVIVKAKFL